MAAAAASPKRKLCELMSDLNLRKCKPKSSQRSVGCQTDVPNETDSESKTYSESEMNEIINKTKREMLSKYYQFMKSSNITEKIIHYHKCEF